MLETDIRKIDFGGKNLLKSHHVNLDTDLDCIIILSSKDQKLGELLYNKIIDAVIDRIHPKNTYKDFSNALENINAFLSSWRHNGEKIKGLHGIIGMYNKKTFLFSTIGKASCYLYNTNQDVIEVTDKEDIPKDFSFISSGDIALGESLVLSTVRILDVLSKDDIKDGLSQGSLIRSGENIQHIFLHEHSGKNIGIISLKKDIPKIKENTWGVEKITHHMYRVLDNSISKKILGYIYFLRDKLIQKSQKTKQVFLGLGILLSICLLYWMVSGFFHIASNTQDIQEAETSLLQAQNHITAASENMNSLDMFTLNIDQAHDIIEKLESQKLFLGDVATLKDNMGILQKQFNGIESFETNIQNTIHAFSSPTKVVKLVSISDKIYIVQEKGIIGPVLQGKETETFLFPELKQDDYFIDATVFQTNIVLLTHLGKVVNFAKNKHYSYLDVSDQATWENSPLISAYGSNLYLLSDAGNQILRHQKLSGTYNAGVAYLSDTDVNSIGKILSIAIDGGIYILKEDGSIVKLFKSPKYRLEGIVLNNLPKNYNFTNTGSSKPPSIRARGDLNYVYMLLENKIFIFKPNTIIYRDVTSLEYIGQIEGKNIIIEDFYVDNFDEIFVAGSHGIYKLEFDIVDNDIILK